MGLLAEQKFKQKWSVDPNNLAWRKNEKKNSFGMKMMSKMGWKEGDGLGKDRQGRTKNITATVKNNNFGIGCNAKNADDFVAGQDEFNAVLKMLNDNDTSELANHKRAKKRAIQKKALSSRFVKAKDLSGADSGDLSAIFGKSGDIFSQIAAGNGAKKEEQEVKQEAEKDADQQPETSQKFEESNNVTTSTMSYQDYFAKKLAQKKGLVAKQETLEIKTAEVKQETEAEPEEQPIKKSKKKKKRKAEAIEAEEPAEIAQETEEESPKKKKKKSKKLVDTEVVETDEKPKKKKKKRKSVE